jgi:hypothetical protein
MKDRESLRAQLWIDTWLVVARAETCRTPDIPTVWADRAVKDFDSRFPETKEGEDPAPPTIEGQAA